MNELKIFEKAEFGQVRVRMDNDGNPWFVAKDVCHVLGISDHHQAAESLDGDERGRCNIPTPSGIQEMLIISESGMYSLVFRSRKPEARAFSKWVRAEVLPSIRRTGGYIISKPGDTPETIMARAMAAMQESVQRLAEERDLAVHTKAQIGAHREATAMATAAAAVRKCEILERRCLALESRLSDARKALDAEFKELRARDSSASYQSPRDIAWLPEMFKRSGGMYRVVDRELSILSAGFGYPKQSGTYNTAVIAAFKGRLERNPLYMARWRNAVH